MSYAENIEQAISNCRQQTVLMQRCLSQGKLMDALKHTSIMLTELRSPTLSPKQYYELYILIYDSLSILSSYFVECHPKKHHLADLYELVQYAGNILPRLYLMITVGSSYLQSSDAPREEILKDMIEMCKGVQNPIRGLFLRYYLSQRTKPFFETEDPEAKRANISLIVANFIEMNKLWVRLQHQGPLREREQRTRERKELKILVGTNLVRLSQIVESDFAMYRDEILPLVLEQVVQCRDIVSQEYLLDVICQVFPDEFHLGTLSELLSTTLKLSPAAPVNEVVLTLVERLNGYIDRQEHPGPDELAKKLESLDISSESQNVFFVFWKFLNQLNEERPDLSLQEFAPIIKGILKLTLRWYPDNLSNVDVLLKFMYEKCKESGQTVPEDYDYLFQELLLANDLRHDPRFFYQVLTKCESYQKLFRVQNKGLQKFCVNEILDAITHADLRISSETELQKILGVCEVMIEVGAEKASSSLILDEDDGTDAEKWSLNADQEKLAKIAHLCYNKSIEKHTELLIACREWFQKGDKNAKYLYPAVICNIWKLIRKCQLMIKRKPQRREKMSTTIKQLFKLASRTINELYNTCEGGCLDLLYKLNLQTASLADQLELGDIAYDFFSQAFTIFEESLSDSRTQFQAIVNMAQTLQKTRSLYAESSYDTLITRCTLHGSKLLKKQDQCRAVYTCSHLWWATEISLLGEEEGVTDNFFREGKRVLECLQRSLRVADSIMDNVQSCQLMVEILNRCCYYFVHGDENSTHVGTKYINGLIELIKTNLKSLKMEANQGEDSGERFFIGTDGSYIHQSPVNSVSAVYNKPPTSKGNNLASVPIEFFQRTLQYIEDQKDVDERFKAISVGSTS
ncbi:retromer subunit VPS35 [Lachancea thermotolerans CBS 6340]|uniref:Vacuolar protein sorting-associated protein 35 n=1 Tax=Lachancea thermotolerans (strain ATCC 56472 / CBS 6340 / NRRL Y-8284) TaxID=559295 RepID=C5DKJ2_LACTC|nr:KLTH0F05148p [Lachancea thermotolerans CBS 6340]CAR23993.1 KLTH0F05148p [Lachancea thermotolerans CBS 6340]